MRARPFHDKQFHDKQGGVVTRHRPVQPRSSRRPTGSRSGQAGSVTAETAVILPLLLVVLTAAISVLAIVGAQLRCVDAARSAARVAARGDSLDLVRSTGERSAPAGAAVRLISTADTVEVVITAEVRPLGGALRIVPVVAVRGRAVAAREAAP